MWGESQALPTHQFRGVGPTYGPPLPVLRSPARPTLSSPAFSYLAGQRVLDVEMPSCEATGARAGAVRGRCRRWREHGDVGRLQSAVERVCGGAGLDLPETARYPRG